jgi:hypothetical protein
MPAAPRSSSGWIRRRSHRARSRTASRQSTAWTPRSGRVYTGAIQRARLAALGLRTVDLPPLRDVDDIAAARAVAAEAPDSRFAAVLAEIEPREAAA